MSDVRLGELLEAESDIPLRRWAVGAVTEPTQVTVPCRPLAERLLRLMDAASSVREGGDGRVLLDVDFDDADGLCSALNIALRAGFDADRYVRLFTAIRQAQGIVKEAPDAAA